jgi:sulfite exporter TauE/SafE
MCGAISGALSMSLPAGVRTDRGQLLVFNLLFSLGRVASYGIAGALTGALGGAMSDHLIPPSGVNLLRLLPALMVAVAGLYIGGWLPRLGILERIGSPLWRRLEPIGRRLIPIRSPGQALAYGLIWGWLPCGLVYWALLIGAASASSVTSALFMVVFGLATLPAILATGMLAGWIQQLRRASHVKQAAGLLLIILGVLAAFYAVEIEQFLRLQS